MAVTGTGALVRTAPVWPGQRPFLIHYWGWRPAGSGQVDVVRLYETLNQEEWRLRVNNSSVVFQAVNNGDVTSATIATQAPDEQWYSHACSERDAMAHAVYAFGSATQVTSTVSSSPVTPTNTQVVTPANGAIAEISVWDTNGFVVTDDDDLYLLLASGGAGGNGANPLDINEEAAQPWTGRLVAYVRASSTDDICDLSGNGHDFSISGTLSNFASHPPVDSRSESCSPPVGNDLLLLLHARGDN